MAIYQCERCQQPFSGRPANRARGWARFCSLSCRAIVQGPPPSVAHIDLSLAGQRFGRLTALSYAGQSAGGAQQWVCACQCGGQTTARAIDLRKGLKRSCGCLAAEGLRRLAAKNRTHGMTGTATFTVWRSMHARCKNPKSKDYPNYGGRGIAVCERWDRFENFLADMGERPARLTLERSDNERGYEPGNCRWATIREQNLNTRANRVLEVAGERHPISMWAELTGISKSTLRRRVIELGWSHERAVTEPVRRRPA